MIWESSVWKEEMQKELGEFNCYLESKPDFEDDYFNLRVEKFIFVIAFIIRKLIESNKISDELLANEYPAYKYKKIENERSIDFLNYHHVDEFYELACQEGCKFKIREMCNLFIHSFVFMLSFDEEFKNFTGVLINSDRSKNSWLYEIDFEIFVEVINDVINDNIVSVEYSRIIGVLKMSSKNTGKII